MTSVGIRKGALARLVLLLTVVLVVAGAGLLIAAASLVATWAGLLAGGVIALLMAYALIALVDIGDTA
jgi:hypothetical protein